MKLSSLRKSYGWLTLEIWLLIALGGGVRAMNAGLACPDWPLCFGDVIPDYHPQVYLEFVHRAMAGMVAVASTGLAIFVWRRPELPRAVKWTVLASLVLLLAQVILGGLTVLWLLHEKVVTSHLLLGASFFGLNLWLYWRLRELENEPAAPVNVTRGFAWFSVFGLTVVMGQIALGGLVASHYAALSCTDFPLCYGKFIPTLSGTIGLHVMHRLGAYLTTAVVLGLYIWARAAGLDQRVQRVAGWALVVVLWQVAIGIANVLLLTPPLITVLHLATGVALFGLTLRQVFVVRSGLTPSYQRFLGSPSPEGRLGSRGCGIGLAGRLGAAKGFELHAVIGDSRDDRIGT